VKVHPACQSRKNQFAAIRLTNDLKMAKISALHFSTTRRRDVATFFRKANVVNKGKSAFSATPHPYFQSNGGKIFQERQKISLY